MISPATTVIIDKIANIVKRSAQAHSKDIRLEMTDATMLIAEIANITARLAVLENAENAKVENLSVSMHGGKF
jgi:hypothetical protein